VIEVVMGMNVGAHRARLLSEHCLNCKAAAGEPCGWSENAGKPTPEAYCVIKRTIANEPKSVAVPGVVCETVFGPPPKAHPDHRPLSWGRLK